MKSTKGQASLEYLTTYGWALFALVIVLVVIFSSGILSPSYLISEECNFSNNVPCQATIYNTAGHGEVAIVVFNGFPYKVRLNNLTLSYSDGTSLLAGFEQGIEIESGSNHTFRGTLTTPLDINSIKRFNGTITYVSCAPEINQTGCGENVHTISGRLVGRVLG
ncbi:MAG: hypothetical protein ACP5N9_01675 [Candidatus Bilamarchaeum sp.]